MAIKDKKNPDVSIIIVSYNNFDLLDNCLDSVYRITKGIDYEVIIVDNASKESGLDIVVAKYKNLTLIRNDTNRGFASANNQGISIAKGKFILLLNNDTVLTENSIYQVFNFASMLQYDCIVGCKLLNPDRTLQHSVYDFPTAWNVFTSNFFLYVINKKNSFFSKYHLMNTGIDTITEVDVVTGAFLFASVNGLKKINGFDERFFFYNEETDLCYRFKNAGGKIFYYPDTSVIHIKSGSANKNLWFKFKNQSFAQIRYFQKHFKGWTFYFSIFCHYFGLFIRVPILFLIGLFTMNKYSMKRSIYFFRLLFHYPKNLFKKT